jgi:hypothetical protein
MLIVAMTNKNNMKQNHLLYIYIFSYSTVNRYILFSLKILGKAKDKNLRKIIYPC